MNRTESKYFKTAAKMDEAFLSLLEKKDFVYITVKEICETAGVNRSTFYLHYETIGDLLAESANYTNQRLLDYLDKDSEAFVAKIPSCPLDELFFITSEYLIPYLEFVRDNKRLFRTVVENATVLDAEGTYKRMYRYVFVPILARYGVPEEDHPYMMAFHMQGIMAIVIEWLKNDCADSIEHIISVMQKCVNQYKG